MKKDDLKKTFSEMGLKSQAKLLDDLETEHARASGTPAPKSPRKVHGSGKALPRPFLKWAGGKARMAQHVVDLLPESFRTYYEPFLGGGAVFFELARRRAFKKAVLADANADLIACYTAVRDDVDGVLDELMKPLLGRLR